MTRRPGPRGKTIVEGVCGLGAVFEFPLSRRLSIGEGGGDDTDPRGCGPWLVTVALAAIVFAAIRGAA
jgi:hypothetical protein